MPCPLHPLVRSLIHMPCPWSSACGTHPDIRGGRERGAMAAQQSSCVWRCTVMWSGQYYSLLEIFKEMAHELCPPTSNTWRLPCALRSSMTRVPAGICYKKMKWLMKLSIPSSF